MDVDAMEVATSDETPGVRVPNEDSDALIFPVDVNLTHKRRKGKTDKHKAPDNTGKWQAVITINNAEHNVGLYRDENDAARDMEKLGQAKESIEKESSLIEDADEQTEHVRACIRDIVGKKKAGKSSQYKGVYWDMENGKWRADIEISGVKYYVGYYDLEDDAAESVNKVHQEKENIVKESSQISDVDARKDFVRMQIRDLVGRENKIKSSKYKGVHWREEKKKWRASITISDVTYYIGYYDAEDDAARNRKIVELAKDTLTREVSTIDDNFARREFVRKWICNSIGRGCGRARTSQFKGVSWCEEKRKWRARISINEIQHYVGYYDVEEDAAKDYKKVHQVKDEICKKATVVENVIDQRKYVRELIRAAVGEEDKDKERGPKPPKLPLPPSMPKHKVVAWSEEEGKWIAQARLHKDVFIIGKYDSESVAGADVDRVNRWLQSLKKDLGKILTPEERQSYWRSRVDEILSGDSSTHVSLSQKGVYRAGKYGWKAVIGLDGVSCYLRTHTGPGAAELAAEDFNAIYPHRHKLALEIKTIADKDAKRHRVQEHWSVLVGCEAPVHRKKSSSSSSSSTFSYPTNVDVIDSAGADGNEVCASAVNEHKATDDLLVQPDTTSMSLPTEPMVDVEALVPPPALPVIEAPENVLDAADVLVSEQIQASEQGKGNSRKRDNDDDSESQEANKKGKPSDV